MTNLTNQPDLQNLQGVQKGVSLNFTNISSQHTLFVILSMDFDITACHAVI